MVLKILKKRERYHSLSDSSLSSPEADNGKWTLSRAPLVSDKQMSALKATPAHKQLDFPPTSTPCLRAAPPFQLSQTLLSPVSKEKVDNSFKVPKPGKVAVAREETFDNLLTSHTQPDSPLKLFVKRREKPLSRRNNEADVDRTRQYAGGRIQSNNFTEACEESELAVLPPTEKHQKIDLPRIGNCVSETATKPAAKLTLEPVMRKVLAEKPCNSKDSVFKTPVIKIDLKNKSKPKTGSSKTVEQIDEEIIEQTQSPSPNKRERKRTSLLQVEEDVQNRTRRLSEQDGVLMNRSGTKPSGKSLQNGALGKDPSDNCNCESCEKASCMCVCGDALGSGEESVVGTEESERSARTNRSSYFREFRQNSPPTESSRLHNYKKSQGKENSGLSNLNDQEAATQVHLTQQTEEKDDATKRKRKSVIEKSRSTPPETTDQKDRRTEQIGEKISSRVSITSESGKITEPAVVCADNGVQTQKKQKTGEDKSKDEEQVTIKRTRRSVKKLKNETLEDVDNVLNKQKFLIENGGFENVVEFLEGVCFTPNKTLSEENTHSSDEGEDVADNPSKKDELTENSEHHKAKCGPSTKGIANTRSPRQDASNRPVSRGRGLARGKSRKKSVEGSDESDNVGDDRPPLSAEHSENDVSKSQRSGNKLNINDELRHSRSTVHAERRSVTQQGDHRQRLTVVESSDSEDSDSVRKVPKPKRKRVQGPAQKIKVAARSSDNASENIRNEEKLETSVEETANKFAEEEAGATEEKRTEDKKNDTRKKKTDKKLTSKKFVSNYHNVPERPKRERRRPGDYWVSVPNLTLPVRQPVSRVTYEGMFRTPTLDFSSGSEDDFRPRKKRKGFKGVGGGYRRGKDAEKKTEKTANVRTQAKKRRLLPKNAVRESQVIPQSSEALNSRGSMDSDCTNGRQSPVLICHADDVTLRNKNLGLSSENSNVRIGATVSWKSLTGSLLELDSGSVSGPQVDVFKHQVYIVIEGSIVFQILGEQERTTLNAGDSSVVPAGYKFTIRNNGSNKARLNVLSFTENI